MPAYFSGVDDRDELGGRLYAVMGHLDRSRPELLLRLGFYGTWLYNIPALTIFDDISPFEEVYLDSAEIARVEAREPAPARGGWLSPLLPWRSK
jgi:hypothetical protein